MEGEETLGIRRWRRGVAVGKKPLGMAVERMDGSVLGEEEKVFAKPVLWMEGEKRRRLHRRTLRLGPRGNILGSRYTGDLGLQTTLLMDQEDPRL
jgi:hypothetical protein